MASLRYSGAAKKIEAQYARAWSDSRHNAGKRFLKLFRRLLRKHNTRRHIITIAGGMGMYYVSVNGEMLMDKRNRQYRATPVYELLHDIQDCLSSDWDYTLEGERLN